MKQWITLWMALLMMALPMSGLAADTLGEALAELATGDAAIVTQSEVVSVEGLENLLPGEENEQTRSAISALLNSLGACMVANTKGDAMQCSIMVNGTTVLDLVGSISETGLAVKSDWLLDKPLTITWEEIKQLTGFDLNAILTALQQLGQELATSTERFPNLGAWVNALAARVEPVQDAAPEGADPAEGAVRLVLTRDDMTGFVDAVFADIQLLPQLTQYLTQLSGKTVEELKTELMNNIAQSKDADLAITVWMNADGAPVAFRVFSDGDEDSKLDTLGVRQTNGAETVWTFTNAGDSVKAVLTVGEDHLNMTITDGEETPVVMNLQWAATDTQLNLRCDYTTTMGELVSSVEQNMVLGLEEGKLAGQVDESMSVNGFRMQTRQLISTTDPIPALDMADGVSITQLMSQDGAQLQQTVMMNLQMGLARTMQALPQEVLVMVTQLMATMQQNTAQ